jgi:hypothetical protein
LDTWRKFKTARHSLGGAGTQTAGLAFGGIYTRSTNATEEYDGTSWTAGGNLNTARRSLAGAGTQTAGLGLVDMIQDLVITGAQKNMMELLGQQVEI